MNEEKKDLDYWKNNCEDDYITTPISVLRYIGELEKAINKNSVIPDVSDNEVGWFNEYGEVDDFLFNELDKKGKEFPIITELKPSPNTIEAIKLLCSGR